MYVGRYAYMIYIYIDIYIYRYIYIYDSLALLHHFCMARDGSC